MAKARHSKAMRSEGIAQPHNEEQSNGEAERC